MAYKILTQNSIDNTNIDGARAEHFNAGMRNGIVKGAFNEGNFSALSSNVIMLDTCELRISGHRVVIDEAWTHAFSSKPKTPQRYAVVGQVTVGEDTNVTFDLIVQLTDVNLVKNNLFRQPNGAGIYQEEIGRFTLNTDGSVIDVTRTIDIITGSKGEDLDGTINIGVVKTNTLEAGLEAEVDVEQRYDAEQKKVLTDFNFNIPRGQGIDNLDVELSEASTNAVQNQAIAKAINNKADKTELETKADKTELETKADLTNDEQEIRAGTLTAKKLQIKTGVIEFDDSSNTFWTDFNLKIGENLEFGGLTATAKTNLLDVIYPVGSVYININNTSPASFLGGTWEKIPEKYALWTTNETITNEGESNAWSGEGVRRLKSALPNIKGSLTNAVSDQIGVSGAFYNKKAGKTGFQGSNNISWYSFDFSAYNGDDSTYKVYRDEVDYVQPPAYKVHAWKRTA